MAATSHDDRLSLRQGVSSGSDERPGHIEDDVEAEPQVSKPVEIIGGLAEKQASDKTDWPSLENPSQSAVDFLRSIESHSLSGAWSWSFDDDVQVWSPGCFRVLGLDAREMRPSYDLLLELVHPDDRSGVVGWTDLLRDRAPCEQTFRIIRPDRTVRILTARTDIKFDAAGRPRSAIGTLVDMTDRERALRARALHCEATRSLNQAAGILSFSMSRGRRFHFEPEASAVLGRPLRNINEDPFAGAIPSEREEIYRTITAHQSSGDVIKREVTLRTPGQPPRLGRVTMVPALREPHEVATWQGLLQIFEPTTTSNGDCGTGPGAVPSGFHLRAARTLVGWSMLDLATASGLSLSTVRRVEDDLMSRTGRSRERVMSALCGAGVQFLALGDGKVAVTLGS